MVVRQLYERGEQLISRQPREKGPRAWEPFEVQSDVNEM